MMKKTSFGRSFFARDSVARGIAAEHLHARRTRLVDARTASRALPSVASDTLNKRVLTIVYAAYLI